jgi:hypothetical protein
MSRAEALLTAQLVVAGALDHSTPRAAVELRRWTDCGGVLPGSRRDARFCSLACRVRAFRRRRTRAREGAYAAGTRARAYRSRSGTKREIAAELETAQPR